MYVYLYIYIYIYIYLKSAQQETEKRYNIMEELCNRKKKKQNFKQL